MENLSASGGVGEGEGALVDPGTSQAIGRTGSGKLKAPGTITGTGEARGAGEGPVILAAEEAGVGAVTEGASIRKRWREKWEERACYDKGPQEG